LALVRPMARLRDVPLVRYRGATVGGRTADALESASWHTPADMETMPFCQACGDPRVLATGYSPHSEGFEPWTIYGCGHVLRRDAEPIEELIPASADVTVSVERSDPPVADTVPDTMPDRVSDTMLDTPDTDTETVTVSLRELTGARLITSLPGASDADAPAGRAS
jgi:hypothetical protein